MGVGDVWSRALVYFGIVEEEEYWDEEGFVAEDELERTYGERPNVRRLAARRAASGDFDDWSEPEAASAARTAVVRPTRGRPPLEAVASASVRVHLVVPRSFNLQGTDTELSKRLIDFSSGLTYALNGGMQRVADKVFLLTPRNVEVSAEERARLIERGFFNQS